MTRLASLPLITVITAFGRPEYAYLREAGESLAPLAAYSTPTGHGIEWIVVVDHEEMTDDIEAERRVDAAIGDLGIPYRVVIHGEHNGPGPARNAGLQHATAPWVYSLDGDDLVNPDTLRFMHYRAEQRGEKWVAARSTLLDADGDPIGGDTVDVFASGKIHKNGYFAAKIATGRWPFNTNSVLARTDVLQGMGGWADLPRGEDTAMVSVLSSLHAGLWIPETVHLYRLHPGSLTAPEGGWQNLDEPLDVIAGFISEGSTRGVLVGD